MKNEIKLNAESILEVFLDGVKQGSQCSEVDDTDLDYAKHFVEGLMLRSRLEDEKEKYRGKTQ